MISVLFSIVVCSGQSWVCMNVSHLSSQFLCMNIQNKVLSKFRHSVLHIIFFWLGIVWVLNAPKTVMPTKIGIQQPTSQVYTWKGCTPIQVFPLVNAYTNSCAVCSCIYAFRLKIVIRLACVHCGVRIEVHLNKNTYYAWAHNKRVGAHIEERKYLFWCTPFWCVNLWYILSLSTA